MYIIHCKNKVITRDQKMDLGEISSRQKQISKELIDSIYLLRIFEKIVDGDGEMSTLLRVIKNKVTLAFNEIEKCRNIV